jgi:hypothetical protein
MLNSLIWYSFSLMASSYTCRQHQTERGKEAKTLTLILFIYTFLFFLQGANVSARQPPEITHQTLLSFARQLSRRRLRKFFQCKQFFLLQALIFLLCFKLCRVNGLDFSTNGRFSTTHFVGCLSARIASCSLRQPTP